MDLAQLKFVVDTSDLKNAAAEIDKLSTAVSKLNKPIKDAAKASQELNKEQTTSEKTATKTTESVKKQTTVLERQQAILEFMTEGYSKGQASQLAYAKAAGALSSDIQLLGQVLQTQRKLMGTDPFDKSIGAMQALRNEYTVTKEVQRLYNADLGLTKSQMEDLAKEKLRLIEKYKLEGASLSDIKNGLMELNAAYIKNASSENNIVSAMKAKQKASTDVSKANQYIINELDRVNRLTQENGNITSATNNALIRFEKALKMSGMSAEEQALKLQGYKKSLAEIQKQAGNRQVDYLSRALGPQITDIFVGLATGQSPMMVLLQQGGQLRDQFALAGVASKDMANMLSQAAKSMITSVKDVAIAVGGLLVNTFISVGQAVLKSAIDPFKQLGVAFTGLISGSMSLKDALSGLTSSLVSFAKTGAVAAALALAALAIEYVKITQVSTGLSQAIALSGAGFGMNAAEAKAFAESLSSAGGNTLKFMKILTEFAKVGQKPSEEMVRLADNIDKYLGQSIDKTAQEYDKLSESPLRSLIDIAKQTGFVSEATLRQVYALEQVGNKTEAAKVAQAAYISAMQKSVAMAKDNLDPLQMFWIDIKKSISGAMDEIYKFATTPQVVEGAKVAFNIFKTVLSGLWTIIKQVAGGVGGLFQAVGFAAEGKFSEAADALTGAFKSLVGYEEKTNDVAAAQQKAGEVAVSTASKEREANAQAANAFTDKMKVYEDYLKILKQANDNYINLAMSQQHLTKSEAALSQLRASQDWKKLTAEQKAQIESLYQAAAAIEHLKLAEEGRKRSLEFIANLTGQAEKMGSEYYANLQKLNEAQLELGLSAEQYGALANEIYKLSNSYKALAAAQSTVNKDVMDIAAARQSITDQYGMDFATPDQKARVAAQSKLKKDTAAADAEYAKSLVDAYRSMNDEEYKQALVMYTDKYNKKKELAQAAYDRETYILSEGYKRQQAYSQAFEGLFNGMADAIVEFAKTGKLSFGDLINTMISDLIRFEMRMQMMKIYESFGGSSGILSAVTSMFGFADGGAFGGNGIQAFAKGGTFTNSIVSEPTLFKFAKGTGLMGEAGPEAIMPLARDSSGKLGVQASSSGGSVSVNIINNTNAQASATETTDSKGNRKVEVVIGDMAASEISRSGSSSQKSIRSTFGIQPQLIRR